MSTYTSTTIKGMDVTTPTEGSTPPSEVNNAIREVKDVLSHQHAVASKSANYTLKATDSIIICSNSITITMPTISDVASASYTKHYYIWNNGTGTITIGGTVNGISNPTIGPRKLFHVFTDGTSWFSMDLAMDKFNEKRALFTYKDDDEIYISAAQYYCSDKFCWWDAQLTSDTLDNDLGGAPSNSTWYYLYLDYSAITGGMEITNSELLWSATAPTWTEANRAWMNGSDRCIFAVYVDASGNITEFYHDGGDLIMYADYIADLADTDIDTTWTDVTLTLPGFSIKALITGKGTFSDGNADWYWRINGQTGTTGHIFLDTGTNYRNDYNTTTVLTDSSQKIEVKAGASNGNTIRIQTDGWYFPIGM